MSNPVHSVELDVNSDKMNRTLNIRNDGKLELIKPGQQKKSNKIISRINSSNYEKLDVILSTTPPVGKISQSVTRASLISKKDFGC